MPKALKPAHVNPPKQGRSQRTLERIVAASLELLATEGPAGLTVHAVVEKAESSVGSFYARFNGKDDLLDYLGERVWADAAARWNEALVSRNWAALTLPQIAEGSVVLLIDAQRSRSVYLKALDWATGRHTDAYETFRSELLLGLSEILLVHADSIDHHDPQLAVRLGLRAILGVVDAESRAIEGRLSRDELVEECCALLIGYLMGRDGFSSTSAGVEYFDVWG